MNKIKKNFKLFIGLIIISLGLLVGAWWSAKSSVIEGEEVAISYNESSELNYKVWLKENEFYDEDYLGEEYNVVASAIDEIEIDFDYLLNFSDYVQGESYYTITSRIVAYQKADASEKKIWDYERKLIDKAITLFDVETVNVGLRDNFKIDYQEYRKLMDNYKKNYAVSLVGNLIVEIDIESDLSYFKFEDKIGLGKRKMRITIPLTEQVVKIVKSDVSDNSQTLIEKDDVKIVYWKLFLAIVMFLSGLVLGGFLIGVVVKLYKLDSRYVRKLHKILRTYDSIIVNVEELQLGDCSNVIYVNSFYELLDAQAEYRVPILYYNVCDNKECRFALKYGNDIFVYNMCADTFDKVNKSDKDEKK